MTITQHRSQEARRGRGLTDVVGVRHVAADAKELDEVVELAVDVTLDGDDVPAVL